MRLRCAATATSAAVGLALLVGACDFAGGQTLEHTTASDCASCHSEQAAQWRQSAHAVGDRSPVFQAYVEHVETQWGRPAADQCTSCHAPEHSGADGNITCISCHASVGNRGTRNGALIVNLSQPLAGPVGATDANAPHRSRPGGFLKSPELCGTCHEVTSPGLLDEPTFTEFEQSPAAKEGRTCASCHMPERAPGPVADGSPKMQMRRDHSFQGVDPLWHDIANPAHWDRVRGLLAEALELSTATTADAVVVRLENVGAGHSVPTGMAALRDLWVDVTLADGEGRIVGTLERVLVLGDQPMSGGNPVPLFTDGDSIRKGSLAAGESTAVSIDATVAGVAFESAQATLRFRSVRVPVLEALGLDALAKALPIVDIDSATATLN